MGRLTPRVHPIVAAFLAEAALDGSPRNVVFPQVFAENVASFREVLRQTPHRIAYAHKVNQSADLARAAFEAGIDIDVASAGELASALAAGFTPDRIEATGPKGETMLRALLAHPGLVINVDNPWELRRIAELAERPVPVLLRMSGGRRISRFGMAPEEFGVAYELIRSQPGTLDLLGVSFHLDTSDVAEKARAVETALGLVESAYANGLGPKVLNVGGGYRQAYLADPDEFDGYVQELRRGLLGQGPALGWGDYTFGYQPDRSGGLRGTPVFHRYANAVPGTEGLRELLETPIAGGHTIARTLQESLLELWIEPGKALVDHAGITIATVEFTKTAADGRILVNLDLSRDAVTPSDQEVMLDPVVIYRESGPSAPCGVFLAGNLCLERDMVSNHLIRLPRLPRPGDLVVFVNTAAYQMDLSAAPALMHPRLPKVAAVSRDGLFTVTPDGDRTCSTTPSRT